MTKCAWPEGCEQAGAKVSLCKRHYQLATRRGVLEEFRQARTCKHCGDPLPKESRSSRVYCSQRCNSAVYRKTNPVDPEVRRGYVQAHLARLRAATHATRADRRCENCDAPLPVEANSRRRFCGRYCINQSSLRRAVHGRREACHRYRVRLRASGPGVSERDWARLVNRHHGRCAYCGIATDMTMDHVVPLSRGGQHAIGNLLPACRSCNASKRDDFLIFWRLKIASARLAAATAA